MSTNKTHQEQRIEFQERIIWLQGWSSCLNCEYWNKEDRGCLKFAAPPPVEVVVVGCPAWTGACPF